jgi:hypothetical protein
MGGACTMTRCDAMGSLLDGGLLCYGFGSAWDDDGIVIAIAWVGWMDG